MKTLEELKHSASIEDRALYVSVLRETIRMGESYIEMCKNSFSNKYLLMRTINAGNVIASNIESFGIEVPKIIHNTLTDLKKKLAEGIKEKIDLPIQLIVNVQNNKLALKNYKPYNKIPPRKHVEEVFQQAEEIGII